MLKCKEILKKRIEDEFFFRSIIPEEGAIKERLNEIITNMDKQIAFENKCDFKQSGCTFTLLIYYTGTFYLANIGSAHCLWTTQKESKYGTSSRGNMSSIGGSEVYKMSNISGGGSGITAKTASYATTNPMKAVAFLYKATNDLVTNLYGGRFPEMNLADVKNTQMEIISTDHSCTNYEELLRLTQMGGSVAKDRKKTDLPYYARVFKLYMNPLVVNQGLPYSSEWPALKVSRYFSYA